MNYPIVFRSLGNLILLLGATQLVPWAVAWHFDEASISPIGYSIIAAGIVGILVGRIPVRSDRFRFKESVLTVTLGWISFSLLGALPWIFAGILEPTAAIFETMSGLTTTGASVINDIEALDHGLLFWRSLTHWIGGMGIIVLSLAIMPLLGKQGGNLYKAEVPGPTTDKFGPKLQATAKVLWYVYALITILETGALWLAGMSLFDAVNHAFATVATGGFSTKNASIAAYGANVQWIITFFMFLAGANFALHFHLLGNPSKIFKGPAAYWRDFEFRTYFLITFGVILAIGAILWTQSDLPFEKAIRDASFQAVSIITTTGFVSADYSQWPALAQGLIFALMFIGGCGGSTGGGIKVIRHVILFRSALQELKKTLHPQGVFHLKVSGQPVREEVLAKVLAFFFIYVLLILVTGLMVSFTGPDLGTSMSAALVSVGNIGPGFAGVGPVENFTIIPPAGQWVLMFGMLAGRLELFTVLVLFTRSYWKH
jgi:trk system potassium uptake protein TrkH